MNPLNTYTYLAEHHIRPPYIPPGLEVREAPDLYNMESYVNRATQPREFVRIGLAGDGLGSSAIHYYCVTEKVAIFFQLSTSPLFDDEANSRRIDGNFALIKTVFEWANNADIPPGKRLVVVVSDLKGENGWGFFSEGKMEWHPKPPDKTVIHDVLGALLSRKK
jgi:hypothetical protein